MIVVGSFCLLAGLLAGYCWGRGYQRRIRLRREKRLRGLGYQDPPNRGWLP